MPRKKAPSIAKDWNAAQFERALKRNNFRQLNRLLGVRYFDLETGEEHPAVNLGRFGGVQRRFTVKHLLQMRAIFKKNFPTLSRAPELTPLEKAASAPLTPGMPATI